MWDLRKTSKFLHRNMTENIITETENLIDVFPYRNGYQKLTQFQLPILEYNFLKSLFGLWDKNSFIIASTILNSNSDCT